jgi:hypothetical protein
MSKMLKVGFAAGAAVAALAYLQTLPPDRRVNQLRRNRALDAVYRRAARQSRLRVSPSDRLVIFSDHHKGARDAADDFRPCEQTYLTALAAYNEQAYSLVNLGDAEELLEQGIPEVVQAYDNVLRAEAAFYPGRYWRVFGNHDILWREPDLVRLHLEPYFPGIFIHEALILEFPGEDGKVLGEGVLLHGHQGTIDADILGTLAARVLPIYRQLQILTGIGRTTPAQDACLRSLQDTHMYRWVRARRKTFLVAGHTHRPVWSSATHLENLYWELFALLELPPEARPDDFEAQISALMQAIERREQRYPPCDDTIKTRPCYFNSGCCRFADGDITGIEIADGSIRLVKWGADERGEIVRAVLEQTPLAAVFAML